MANKSDLRYIKTDRLIQKTYLELRLTDGKPVKVSTLCEAALINKTTFYVHYLDMEDLHRQVCEQTIRELVLGCPHVMDAFTETQNFVSSLIHTLLDHQKLIWALFGEESAPCTNLIEQELLKLYLPGNDDPGMELKIRFAIGGALRILAYEKYYHQIDDVVTLLKKVLED